jgi:hypothetical protein
MKMSHDKQDSQKVIKAFASALAQAEIFGPAAIKMAAAHIRSHQFSAGNDECEVVAAFAAMLEARANRKEKALRAAFGGNGAR